MLILFSKYMCKKMLYNALCICIHKFMYKPFKTLHVCILFYENVCVDVNICNLHLCHLPSNTLRKVRYIVCAHIPTECTLGVLTCTYVILFLEQTLGSEKNS